MSVAQFFSHQILVKVCFMVIMLFFFQSRSILHNSFHFAKYGYCISTVTIWFERTERVSDFRARTGSDQACHSPLTFSLYLILVPPLFWMVKLCIKSDRFCGQGAPTLSDLIFGNTYLRNDGVSLVIVKQYPL